MAPLDDVDPDTGLPRLYTLDQVAAATGLSARALADGARADKFEHIRLGGKRYMTKAQVTRLLDQSTRRTRTSKTEAEAGLEAAYDRAQTRLERRLAGRRSR